MVKLLALLFILIVVCYGDDTMEKLQQEMFEKLKKENNIDDPEEEEALRSVIMNANSPDGGDQQQIQMNGFQPEMMSSFMGGGGGGGLHFVSGDDQTEEEPEEESKCDLLANDGTCVSKDKAQEDDVQEEISRLKSTMSNLRQSLSGSISGTDHDKAAEPSKDNPDANESQAKQEWIPVSPQLNVLQESMQLVLSKMRVFDTKFDDISASISELQENYERNTVKKCQSGNFNGCQCSKCCEKSWNCDGTKEIAFTEAFQTKPSLVVTTKSLKSTQTPTVMYYDISKESFKLQYVTKDNSVNLEDVQVNWMACA